MRPAADRAPGGRRQRAGVDGRTGISLRVAGSPAQHRQLEPHRDRLGELAAARVEPSAVAGADSKVDGRLFRRPRGPRGDRASHRQRPWLDAALSGHDALSGGHGPRNQRPPRSGNDRSGPDCGDQPAAARRAAQDSTDAGPYLSHRAAPRSADRGGCFGAGAHRTLAHLRRYQRQGRRRFGRIEYRADRGLCGRRRAAPQAQGDGRG